MASAAVPSPHPTQPAGAEATIRVRVRRRSPRANTAVASHRRASLPPRPVASAARAFHTFPRASSSFFSSSNAFFFFFFYPVNDATRDD